MDGPLRRPTVQDLRAGTPSASEVPSGAKWWGKSALVTFVWAGFRIFESDAL
ncbi:hypothetical protein [Pseudomonas sp. Irchel 3A5]|uniref:hypothetical protein n=1 Tax=Pseudomonas sp. Irchel 3A5 TaxID=2008911 RepID=UPI001596084F|nr:hypothetical protein [Pseudomonas sp. Irchel 3A5]